MNQVKAIFKFPLPYEIGTVITILMPPGAVPLHFALQNGIKTMWAAVDFEETLQVERRFAIVGTGVPLPFDYKYVGTLQEGEFVWHLFEVAQ